MQHVGAQPEEPAAGVERGREPVLLLPGVVHRDQVLGAVLHPLDRPPQRAGQPGHQEVLGIELAAGAEPAARVHRVHVDQGLVHAEQPGQQVAVEHRHLGHAEDRQPAGDRVGLGEQGARLQRDRAVPPDPHLGLHHVGGPGERGGHVAVAQGEVGGHVAAREQPGRAGAGRGGGVQHRGRLVDIHVHQFGRVLGQVRVLGHHHGQRLAHVPDRSGRPAPAAGSRSGRCPGHRAGPGSPGPAGQVSRGDHGQHPGRRAGQAGAHRAAAGRAPPGSGRPGPTPGRARTGRRRTGPARGAAGGPPCGPRWCRRRRRAGLVRSPVIAVPRAGRPAAAGTARWPAPPRRCPGSRCTGTGWPRPARGSPPRSARPASAPGRFSAR